MRTYTATCKHCYSTDRPPLPYKVLGNSGLTTLCFPKLESITLQWIQHGQLHDVWGMNPPPIDDYDAAQSEVLCAIVSSLRRSPHLRTVTLSFYTIAPMKPPNWPAYVYEAFVVFQEELLKMTTLEKVIVRLDPPPPDEDFVRDLIFPGLHRKGLLDLSS